MITAIKGDFKIKTTKKVFEEQLRPLGYRLASENREGAAEEVAPFVEKEEIIEEKAEEIIEEAEEEKEEAKLDKEFGFKKDRKRGSK